MKIGGKYNWKNQQERLVYLGNNLSGNGYWHQFAKVESPDKVWCEIKDSELHMIEETKDVVDRIVMCELCDADERTEEQAELDNWKYTCEGWICESCYAELQEPHNANQT